MCHKLVILTIHFTCVTIHIESTSNDRITMQPGIVVRIRVNPTTCMSVLDVLEAVGIKTADKTFSTCVSAALNILVETAKSSGVLAQPDPYEFAERMQYHTGDAVPDRKSLPKDKVGHMNPLVFPDKTPDLGTPKWARQSKTPKPVAYTPTAEDLEIAARERARLGIAEAPVVVDSNGVNAELSDDPMVIIARKEAGKKLTDLLMQKERADSGVGGAIWGEKDQEEYDRVFKVAYPNG